MSPREPMWVADEDLEHQLEILKSAAGEPSAGIFGPASLTWRVDREAALFSGAGRALLLQLAHPWVAAGIAEHSRTLADPIGRFHRTFGVTFTMVFGTLDQALGAARRLHRRHAAIRGAMPEEIGAFAQGSPYQANEIDALRWVYSTLTETAIIAHDLVLPALAADERERYYVESHRYAALFGIPRNSLPGDWQGFAAYNEAMWSSDVLAVGNTARTIAETILAGGTAGLRAPPWYRTLTAHLLPCRLREEFGFVYGDAERRQAEHAIAWIRRVYSMLPPRLRYVGPYHEAIGRLAGRTKPDRVTQWLNRIWIGQPQLGETARRKRTR